MNTSLGFNELQVLEIRSGLGGGFPEFTLLFFAACLLLD